MIEPEKDDKWQKRVEDWFTLISSRQELCGEYYPFIVDKNLDEDMPLDKIFIALEPFAAESFNISGGNSFGSKDRGGN